MKYVICHGTLVSGQKFERGSTEIGFYVEHFGELLPQRAAVKIVRDQEKPTKTIEDRLCREMRLTPLTQHDWSAFTQALGPHARSPEVYLLPAATTLSELVTELKEDELRMITCTALEGASRVDRSEEVLPGIKMDIPAARMTERKDDVTFQFTMSQTVLKREKSAEAAADFIDKLGTASAELWSASNLTFDIMTEWSIARLPAITENAESWVDTVWYVMSPKLGPTTFTDPNRYPKLPGFGAEARARLEKINGYLAAWPACVTQLAQIYDGGNKFQQLWLYLEHPATDNAVTTTARYYRTVIVPVRRSVAVLDPGKLDTWHDYALTLQAVDPSAMAGLTPFVNVTGTRQWMADCASNWDDFARTWSIVREKFGATIAPLLLDASQHDEFLRSRITASQPTYVDGMDFAPESPLTTTPAQVRSTTPSLFCPHCSRLVQHQATDLATAKSTHHGVRMCAGCQTVIGAFDDLAAFACTGCQSIAFTHTTCLGQ